MKVKPQFRGSIILLHDGGGDRSATVAALPVLIDALRAHGYAIVPVSALNSPPHTASDGFTFSTSLVGRHPDERALLVASSPSSRH